MIDTSNMLMCRVLRIFVLVLTLLLLFYGHLKTLILTTVILRVFLASFYSCLLTTTSLSTARGLQEVRHTTRCDAAAVKYTYVRTYVRKIKQSARHQSCFLSTTTMVRSHASTDFFLQNLKRAFLSSASTTMLMSTTHLLARLHCLFQS